MIGGRPVTRVDYANRGYVMARGIPFLMLPTWLVAVCVGCGSACSAQVELSESKAGTVEQNSPDGSAPSRNHALAIIDAAIEAFGGESNFPKANIGRTVLKIEGAFQPGLTGKFTKVDTFQLPGRLHRTVQGVAEGRPVKLEYVFDGDKGWMQINGGEPTDVPMPKPITQTFPSDSLNAILAVRSSNVHLSITPEQELRGQPVHCVRMEVDGRWVGNTYFHKETGLVVASTKSLFDASTGKTRAVETHYGDYQNAGGLKIPRVIEMLVDGKSMTKITVTEVTFMRAIDPSIFAKPQAAP